MEILFIAINAKYIHRNLALDQLQAICFERGINCKLHESNISQGVRDILLSCDFESFDHVFFSVYLWNEAMVRELAEDIKRIKPDIRLFAGGPQAYSRPHDYLPLFDGVIMGDGEAPFASILDAPEEPKRWLRVSTGDHITPLYFEKDLDRWPAPPVMGEHQILYYESSRGCPHHCSYCLSAGTPLVTRDLSRVKEDLTRLVDAEVKLVKFVDRSFNANLKRALEIIDMIKSLDRGITTFHLELTPTGLKQELLHALNDARRGLFRYEIGIQSVSDEVNLQVSRHFKKANYWPDLERFMKEAPGEKHLDMIVGIPGSTKENIEESLNALGELRPEELQLGFLKVLPGTPLGDHAKDLGIIHGSRPPYEVLGTPDLSFEEIKFLKRVERNMDLFHPDSIPFTLDMLLSRYTTFDIYKKLAEELPDLRRATFARRLKALESCFPSDLTKETLELDYLRKRRSPRSLFFPERFGGYEKGRVVYEGYFDGQQLQREPVSIRIDQKLSLVEFIGRGES